MRPLPATLALIVATYVDRTLRFLLLIATGRQAGPSGLGLALLALLVVELVQTLGDLGFHRSLLQEKRLRRPTVDTAFALTACNGALISLAMFALAGLAATEMSEPSIEPMVRLLAMVPILTSVGQVPDTLLQRRKRFRLIAARTIAAAVIGSGLGFSAIQFGHADYGLVVYALAQVAVVTTASWLLTPYRPRIRPTLSEWGRIGPRSLRLWMSGVVGFFNNRGFDFIAGISLGSAALASLRVGGQIILLLIQVTIGPILAIAYAVLPRLRDQPHRFRAELMIAALISSALLFPTFAGLFALADVVLPVVLGEKWNDLSGILPFMCLIAPALYYQVIVSAGLFGADRNDLLLRLSLFEFAATLILGVLGSKFGLIGIAAAGSLRLYILMPVTWRWVRRTIGFDPKIVMMIALPSSMSTMVMFGVLVFLKDNLVRHAVSYWLTAVIIFSVGVLVYSVMMALLIVVFRLRRHHLLSIINNDLSSELHTLVEVLTQKLAVFKQSYGRRRRATV